MKKLYLLILALLISCNSENIILPSDSVSKIDIMTLNIRHEQYLELKNNKMLNFYAPVEIRYRNQTLAGNIRALGAGSRYKAKWGYKVEIGDKQIDGASEFNLSPQSADPSMIRTMLSSECSKALGLLSFGIDYVFVQLNRKDHGLYTKVERVDKSFFQRRHIEVYELYKAGADSRFTFKEAYLPKHHFSQKIPDDNFYGLYEFIDVLDRADPVNLKEKLAKYLDIDNYLKFHGLNTVLSNWDGHTNNFLVYKSAPDSPFKFIPWDFDLAFYPSHEKSGLIFGNDLINKLIQDPEVKEDYKHIYRNIIKNVYTESRLFPVIDAALAKIDVAFELDPHLGHGLFSLNDEAEKLKKYITARRSYLKTAFKHFFGEAL